jgi:hypothetical protein
MRDKKKAILLSAAHLEERAAARVREAEQLAPGRARRHALNNAAQLRSYAAMKRLLVPSKLSDRGSSTTERKAGSAPRRPGLGSHACRSGR